MTSFDEAERFLTFAKYNFSIRVKLYNMLEPRMTMKNETVAYNSN